MYGNGAIVQHLSLYYNVSGNIHWARASHKNRTKPTLHMHEEYSSTRQQKRQNKRRFNAAQSHIFHIFTFLIKKNLNRAVIETS